MYVLNLYLKLLFWNANKSESLKLLSFNLKTKQHRIESQHIFLYTLCPRSSDPFYTVTYFMKWVTTSLTEGICVKIEETGRKSFNEIDFLLFNTLNLIDRKKYQKILLPSILLCVYEPLTIRISEYPCIVDMLFFLYHSLSPSLFISLFACSLSGPLLGNISGIQPSPNSLFNTIRIEHKDCPLLLLFSLQFSTFRSMNSC